jgi:outer membrane lipoprotein LolB
LLTAVLLAAVLLLPACSTIQTTGSGDPARLEQYESRVRAVSKLDAWALRGRLAVNDENDGGSGTLHWQEGPGGTRMDFHGAMGRGAWRLVAGGGEAELELADGSRYSAETVGELVRGQLGWTIPVENLSWWVRGVQAPGQTDRRTLGEDGSLDFLSQNGWDIEFGRYRDVQGLSLPLKLTARQGGKLVKLAIRDWETDGVDN